MVESWRKASGEFAAQVDEDPMIYSASSGDKLFAKLQRAGVANQPVRLVADSGSFTQWSDFAAALRGIGGQRA